MLKSTVYSVVTGILIYNSETWTLTETLKNRLRAFEMGCLRKILGVSTISHIRNTDIKNQLNIQHDIRSRRLSYFGHVVRMQRYRWPYRAVIQSCPLGLRSQPVLDVRWGSTMFK